MMSEDVERVALDQAISGAIPDDLPGYRQRYTERAIDAILDAGFHVAPTPEVVETVAEFRALDGETRVKLANGQTGQARHALIWYRDYDNLPIGALPATVIGHGSVIEEPLYRWQFTSDRSARLAGAVDVRPASDALVAAVESVRALHRRVTLHEPLGVFPICAVCVGDEQFGQVYYPCPTIAAIDKAMLPND